MEPYTRSASRDRTISATLTGIHRASSGDKWSWQVTDQRCRTTWKTEIRQLPGELKSMNEHMGVEGTVIRQALGGGPLTRNLEASSETTPGELR